MSYETIWEPQGIYQKYWGYLSSPEIFDSFSEIHGDPRFTSIRYVVKDYVGVEVFDVGVKTLLDDRAFNRVAQHANPNIVVAVVTTNPQIIQASEIASSYRLDAYPRKIFEVPSVFRLPKGGFHATSFSCFCSLSQFSRN